MIETTTKDSGRVGVVVPHGVLFRSSSEGKIRQQLIEENLLDAVIGLPANLFYGTGIPAAVLVFKRNKADSNVLFIDASRAYQNDKNQNRLRQADIDKIVATYQARETVDKYAYLASFDEIKDNDFNLNIPRYVDTCRPLTTNCSLKLLSCVSGKVLTHRLKVDPLVQTVFYRV